MSQPDRRPLPVRLAASILLPAMLFLPPVADAQSSLKERVEIAQNLIRVGTRQVLEAELLLDDDEQEGFWKLYDEYDAERVQIGNRYIVLVGAFAERYETGTLTDDDANELLDLSFDIQSDTIELKKRYVARFREVLPGIKVARFYQLENKIQAEVDAALALAIPLADPR